MKKFILLLLTSIMALSASAVITETPEGTLKKYKMSGYWPMSSNSYMRDLSTEVVFADDGKTVYFHNLFPEAQILDGWHTGTVDGNKITISKDEICYEFTWGTMIIKYRVSEVEVSEGEFVNPTDLVLTMDGDHIYFDDDPESPSRFIAFYQIDSQGTIGYVDYMLCLDLQPVEASETAVTIPDTAVKSDYIYYTYDYYYLRYAVKGSVAVDGDDYYFDNLTLVPGVVKGTRSGNKITVKNGQPIGNGSGFYLYAGGIRMDGGKDDYDNPTGEACDVTFTIDDDGRIVMDDADNIIFRVYKKDGTTYKFAYDDVIEPYAGDAPATPSDPYFVTLDDTYLDYYNQYYFYFYVDNVDVKGKYMNPGKMGYYMYLDEDVYEFTKDMFHVEDDMTFIPYGYNDLGDYYGNHDINWEDNFGYIWLCEDMFSTVGVQSVYIVDGEKHVSNVISTDLDGNTYTNFEKPDGVDHLNVQQPVTNPTWYDLNGRRVNGAKTRGVFIVDGKAMIK